MKNEPKPSKISSVFSSSAEKEFWNLMDLYLKPESAIESAANEFLNTDSEKNDEKIKELSCAEAIFELLEKNQKLKTKLNAKIDKKLKNTILYRAFSETNLALLSQIVSENSIKSNAIESWTTDSDLLRNWVFNKKDKAWTYSIIFEKNINICDRILWAGGNDKEMVCMPQEMSMENLGTVLVHIPKYTCKNAYEEGIDDADEIDAKELSHHYKDMLFKQAPKFKNWIDYVLFMKQMLHK